MLDRSIRFNDEKDRRDKYRLSQVENAGRLNVQFD